MIPKQQKPSGRKHQQNETNKLPPSLSVTQLFKQNPARPSQPHPCPGATAPISKDSKKARTCTSAWRRHPRQRDLPCVSPGGPSTHGETEQMLETDQMLLVLRGAMSHRARWFWPQKQNNHILKDPANSSDEKIEATK